MAEVFIHIPKTAGSSFRAILNREYCRRKVFRTEFPAPESDIEQFLKLPTEQQTGYDLVSGHYTIRLVPHLPGFKQIAFLRNPIKLFISTYQYILQAPHNADHEVVNQLPDMEAYVDWCVQHGKVNMLTRHLSGNFFEPITKEDFEKAQTNLTKIDFVLMTKHFDESILILQDALGWDTPFYLYKNVSKNYRKETYQELVPRIKAEHAYDMALYEQGLGLWEDLRQKHSAFIKAHLDAFEKQNAQFQNTVGRWVRVKKQAKYYLNKLKPEKTKNKA